MFTATIETNNSQDWVKTQLSTLKITSGAALQNLKENEPFFILKMSKNIFSSVCTTLAFIKLGQNGITRIRLYFLPNLVAIAGLLLCLVSIGFGLYSHWLLVQAHSFNENLPVSSFPWAYQFPMLVLFFILMLAPLNSQKIEVFKQLQTILSSKV